LKKTPPEDFKEYFRETRSLRYPEKRRRGVIRYQELVNHPGLKTRILINTKIIKGAAICIWMSIDPQQQSTFEKVVEIHVEVDRPKEWMDLLQ
jgi:hypothetical protein